jgi:hypothetical protein
MRDTKEHRAIRAAVNAKLQQLEAEINELIRFCPPSELSTGRRLLTRAAAKVKGAWLRPGDVAGMASDDTSATTK